ncbi:hypothetical protein PT974_10140 [Cladobotryum mycophilum]|uniref:Uncharacterized protein n=1 Tax=Cladobotryum mycophilum TaxID=491253 RepID=A0ABR0S9J2_9HYPO
MAPAGPEMANIPAKKAYTRPGKGAPRESPCSRCVGRMGEHGPSALCCDQSSNKAIICYACAGRRGSCIKDRLAGIALKSRNTATKDQKKEKEKEKDTHEHGPGTAQMQDIIHQLDLMRKEHAHEMKLLRELQDEQNLLQMQTNRYLGALVRYLTELE